MQHCPFKVIEEPGLLTWCIYGITFEKKYTLIVKLTRLFIKRVVKQFKTLI